MENSALVKSVTGFRMFVPTLFIYTFKLIRLIHICLHKEGLLIQSEPQSNPEQRKMHISTLDNKENEHIAGGMITDQLRIMR